MVWLSFIVGFVEVLQHTPRAVTGEIPSKLTLPPQVTEVKDIRVIPIVEIEGVAAGVEKCLCCVPYAVPALLVAYART